MNKKTRDVVYLKLVMRDGEHCRKCGLIPDVAGTLDVDHVVPSVKITKHNIDNAQLLCHPCNCGKNPRGKSRFSPDSARNRAKNVPKNGGSGAVSVENKGDKISPYVCVGASDMVSTEERERLMSAEMLKNKQCEGIWRKWMFRMVEKDGKISVKEAVNSGAEYASCSTRTIPKYLDKLTSMIGPMMIVADEITGVKFVVMKDIPLCPPSKGEFANGQRLMDNGQLATGEEGMLGKVMNGGKPYDSAQGDKGERK